ncbi:MAG TPA: hypothetical protein VL125_07180 [Pelobium sp.]|nr:hypothetical protein [Pelobium sp.]
MRYSIIPLSFLLLIMACKKGNSAKQETVKYPGAVTLLMPQSNEACAVGQIEGNKSVISFTWNKDENSDKYEVVINDLKKGETSTYETVATKLDVSLPVGTPFSWYVRSKSSKTAASSQSSIWKFYVSGPGTATYAPFPADQLSPELKQTVTAVNEKVTLSWVGSHVENSIQGYDVYLSENVNSPSLIKADLGASSFAIDVKSNAIYYWKVITKDKNGNQSDSGVYQFYVL